MTLRWDTPPYHAATHVQVADTDRGRYLVRWFGPGKYIVRFNGLPIDNRRYPTMEHGKVAAQQHCEKYITGDEA